MSASFAREVDHIPIDEICPAPQSGEHKAFMDGHNVDIGSLDVGTLPGHLNMGSVTWTWVRSPGRFFKPSPENENDNSHLLYDTVLIQDNIFVADCIRTHDAPDFTLISSFSCLLNSSLLTLSWWPHVQVFPERHHVHSWSPASTAIFNLNPSMPFSSPKMAILFKREKFYQTWHTLANKLAFFKKQYTVFSFKSKKLLRYVIEKVWPHINYTIR